ncbi:proline iminopeptidase-family hydrolase [Rhodospirillum rubrum]|uniref:Peptidase S33, tricorn interacting factor 1 n=1 Tax=Rhodospirillum rubrum (strain ATCC 11170 / ATH 1.1.1 / DSM 467 / LMG 4362 / NCIMB 8255 / S1) TaxID=269796 RepID=Q2RSB5_RHORT|nr:proline iminopeptidase-family hydrolase [Rhodospirillum rubrum]ABC22980.1 Peptidase S33, tricorn interacting factor 1 [Rhodospirillum rubrum ATCC 11170]AEO48710.1 peptidase S33, tricorn interacting factor 1 [Rhodospirillum rubrum F11]MBK5954605.1 alpha/beta hydrolase [Rhodospirillum rubrum]QXG78966.1 proline iminopeptidase-family hydrolase [Rhodospirillum rubrum]HAP98758.1 alpha/beta hydrolase [Rhodospirillum rubrum]
MAIESVEGFAPFREFQTWYRVTGDLKAAKAPLVIAHGGPGCTHDYVDSFKEIAGSGRAVVHYDQIGNGRSTHLRDKGADFWTVELFLDELDSLLAHLGIAGRYHLLGQSWGGMLSAEHAVRQPAGLLSLTLANSLASMPLWTAAAAGLRAELPAEVRATLTAHEAAGTTDHPDYKAASRAFYDRHVCRVTPWPPEVARTFAAVDDDPTVYVTMNGPTEFHVIGTLRDWSVIDRLPRIDVPTFIYRGAFDEATQACIQPFIDHIGKAEWAVFPDSSHMPHVEVKDICLGAVAAFLDRHDG